MPIPQMKRFRTLYSDRKKESCITLSVLRSSEPSTTNEILVSAAPCAQAITLIPDRPSVPNSLPAIPTACFIFSPTIATVANPLSACIGNILPSSISSLNSSSSTFIAFSASSSFTPIDVLFSEAACETRNTLIPLFAKVVKILLFTPTTPTIDRPVTFIEEIPRISFGLFVTNCLITVPSFEGLKVFFTLIGIFLTQTG